MDQARGLVGLPPDLRVGIVLVVSSTTFRIAQVEVACPLEAKARTTTVQTKSRSASSSSQTSGGGQGYSGAQAACGSRPCFNDRQKAKRTSGQGPTCQISCTCQGSIDEVDSGGCGCPGLLARAADRCLRAKLSLAKGGVAPSQGSAQGRQQFCGSGVFCGVRQREGGAGRCGSA
eukprot:3222949-Amphidinium_carterae.1